MTGRPPGDRVTEALQQLLENEHAAVYGYPMIGVTLSDPGQVARARSAEAAHRLVRDTLSSQLVGRLSEPVPAGARYQPPAPLTGEVSAQGWAVQLEEACAGGYRYLLAAAAAGPSASVTVRQQALTGLGSAAQQAAYWRALVRPDAPTVAFPGA
jgi:hypothetical protein